jgi:flagellar basal-body rod protein FlgB
MAGSLFSSSTIPVLEQVVNFAQARHQVLAGNIANMDTPGYRTRDLDAEMFQDQLKRAIDEQHRQRGAGDINLTGGRGDNPFANVRQGLKAILYHDDSNVGIEQQAVELSKNQMQHNLAMTILTNQFQLLGAAISEHA